jgi:hypothetical protein
MHQLNKVQQSHLENREKMILLYSDYIIKGKNSSETIITLLSNLIKLKELYYRAFARDIAEEYIATTNQVDLRIAELVIFQIYGAIGPIDKAYTLLAKIKKNIPIEIFCAWEERLNNCDFSSQQTIKKKFPSEMIDRKYLYNFTESFQESFQDILFSTPIFTMGSCFAQNLARELKYLNVPVESLWLSEDVNTPLANLAFLKKIF